MQRRGVFNEAVYNKLEERRRMKCLITYSELNLECQLGLDFAGKNSQRDRNILADMLGTISKHEFDKGKPMLSAIVVMKNSHPPEPSFGFYNWAKKIGAWNPAQETENKFYFRQLRELGYP